MYVYVKKYSKGFLSVKFPYSVENLEKIKKINGRKWIESDKIWLIPDEKERIKLLNGLFGAENIVSEVYAFDEDTMIDFKNELKLKNYSVRTQKAYLGHVRRFFQYHKKSFDGIKKDDIKRYLYKLVNEDKSSAYLDRVISALRFLFVDVKKKVILTLI